MAIPQAFIDELLDRIDLVDIIDSRVPLKKKGRHFMACCPFHDEKTPSFSVNQDKQFYHCFGCGAGGNVIGFLMDYERMSFPQAITALADRLGLVVPQGPHGDSHPAHKPVAIYDLLAKVAQYYRQQLFKHPDACHARAYLKRRGLNSDMLDCFELGYAPAGWDNLLKQFAVGDKETQWLIASGMLVRSDTGNKLYDRFRNRIMFPIRDSRGRIIAFGGRAMGDDQPKYLNSPETTVFHKGQSLYGLYQARQAHRHLKRLVIVEGYMDVIALAQYNIRDSVATLGTATTQEHLQLIFRHCSEVVFCFDGDQAGQRAANKALATVLPFMKDGRQARFLFLPDGEDPDSLVRKIEADAFKGLLAQAVPLEQYLFDAQAITADSYSDRARLSARVQPLLTQLPEGVFKELMFDALAKRTGLTRDQLCQHKAPSLAPQPSNRDLTHHTRTRRPPRQPALVSNNPGLYAIGLLLQQPRAALRLMEHPIDISDHEDPHATLLMAMIAFLKQHPNATSATLIGHWTDELSTIFQQLPPMDHFTNDCDIEQVFIDTLHYMQRKQYHDSLDKQIHKLSGKPLDQQSEEDKALIKQLLAKKHETNCGVL